MSPNQANEERDASFETMKWRPTSSLRLTRSGGVSESFDMTHDRGFRVAIVADRRCNGGADGSHRCWRGVARSYLCVAHKRTRALFRLAGFYGISAPACRPAASMHVFDYVTLLHRRRTIAAMLFHPIISRPYREQISETFFPRDFYLHFLEKIRDKDLYVQEKIHDTAGCC